MLIYIIILTNVMPVPSTNWKEATDPNAGSSVIYGAPDIKKISQLFNGDVDVDDVDINSEWYFRDGKLQIVNPAGTFTYIINTGAITADRTLDIPLLDGNDTIVVEAQSQDLTNKGIDISRILGLPISATAIATGALPATSSAIAVDAESAGVDDLDTITGLSDDDVVVLYANSGQTITVKHQASPSADQIKLQGGVDITLSETIPTFLIKKGGAFYQFAGTGSNTFLDNLFAIQDESDTTKQVKFSVGGATTGFSMTLISSQTADRSLTLPDATDTLVARATTDTLTNKTITAENNTIDQSTPNSGDFLRDNGTKFVPSAIQNSDIPSAIDSQKVSLADGDILVGNGSGQATAVTMSGDATISNTGVLSLDPVRYSSVGDLIHQINVDRRNDEYDVDIFTRWWTNRVGVSETMTFQDRFEGGVAHTSSPSTQEGWLTNDHTKMTINTSDNCLQCQADGTTGINSVSREISPVPNTNTWTMRWRTRVVAKANGGDGGRIYCGMSNQDSSVAFDSNHNFTGIVIENSASTTYQIQTVEATNEALNHAGAHEDTQNVVMADNAWYYWELERDSTSQSTIRYFGRDIKYRNEIFNHTFNDSTNTDYNNWKIIADNTSQAGDRTIQFDDFRFYDADAAISNTVEPSGQNGPTSTTISGSTSHIWRSSEYKSETYQEKGQLILSPNSQPYLIEDFKRYTDEEQALIDWDPIDTAQINVDVVNDRINFDCVSDGTNDGISKHLTRGFSSTPEAVSNAEWELRFTLEITSHFSNQAGDAELYIGLSDTPATSAFDVARDFIGIKILHDSTNSLIYGADSDAGSPLQEDQVCSAYELNTPYYVRIIRNSTTNYGVAFYSDPDYKVRLDSSPFVNHSQNGSVLATCDGLNQFVILNNNTLTNDSTIQGTIKDISVWSDSNMGLGAPLATSGNGSVDMHFDPVAFGIHMETDKTTETQFKIRSNITGNLFFTDADNIRTVDISDFTDDTYRFINMNRKLEPNLETPTCWVQVECVNADKAMSINRILYRKFTSLHAHFHYRLKTDEVENTYDADDPNGATTAG